MAFRKISDLSSSLSPSGSGIIPISQDGKTYGTTLDTIKGQIEGKLTGSFSTTSSVDDLTVVVNGMTSSIDELNSFTSSANDRLDSLETFTGSLDTTFATDDELSTLRNYFNTYTSSNDNVNTGQNNRLDALETGQTNIGTDLTTINGRLGSLEVETGSLSSQIETEKGRIDAILLSSDADKDSFKEIVDLINSVDTTNDQAFANYALQTDGRLGSIENTTGSIEGRLNSLETESGSIRSDFNSYTSSNDGRLDSIESKSGSWITLGDLPPQPTPIPTPIPVDLTPITGRLNSLEIESGSIRNDFNQFTSSYLIASASFDQRINDLVNQLNICCATPSPTSTPQPTPVPTATEVPPTATPIPTSTETPVPTATEIPPTATPSITSAFITLGINITTNEGGNDIEYVFDIVYEDMFGTQRVIGSQQPSYPNGTITRELINFPETPTPITLIMRRYLPDSTTVGGGVVDIQVTAGNHSSIFSDAVTNKQLPYSFGPNTTINGGGEWSWTILGAERGLEATFSVSEGPVPTSTPVPTATPTDTPVPTATEIFPTPTPTDITVPAICSDSAIVVQVNDGPIGETVEPLVTYYGSRAAMIYNSVTPSTYQVGTTDYTVNFTINSYNFPNRGDAVDCVTSATGEISIGVWDLKRGKTNPNNNVIGVDDQVTSGEMMYPSYITDSTLAATTAMYGENNPFRPFDLTFANTDIVTSGSVHARTEIRINSIDSNGNDRETQLDQLIGNSGIIKFRQNPKFKTNPSTPDTDACWYSVENYASYRFDANAFYKVLQSDGSYTYYYSPGAPAGIPTQYNQILTSEPNMGGSGLWYGQSYNGTLQRGETPDNGVTTYDGVRPNISVGTILCNGFSANIGDYTFDLSFDFPISISVVLDTPTPTDTPVPTATEVPPSPTPTDTPVPTATEVPPTATPTDTPVPTSTETPTPTDTPVPTATDTPVPNPTPTDTPVPQPTDTPVPTATEAPPVLPTSTPVPNPTPTDTPVPQPTDTPAPTSTPVPNPTPTDTPVPQPTDTPVPQPTDTPVPQPTDTPVPQPTDTPVPQPTATPVPNPTPTPTVDTANTIFVHIPN